jgi:Leucine-rich repeat (LRR) protein
MVSTIRFLVALISLVGMVFPPAAPVVAQPLPREIVVGAQPQMEEAFSCAAVREIPQDECRALVAIYEETGGFGWRHQTNWLQNNTPSTWYGVSVNNGHVTGLNLANNGLTGEMPAALNGLRELRRVELRGNALQGELPDRLAGMSDLGPMDRNRLAETEMEPVERADPRSLARGEARDATRREALRQAEIDPFTTDYLPEQPFGRPAEPTQTVLHGLTEETAVSRPYTPPSADVIAATQAQVMAFDCATVSEIPLVECQALVALYNSTNGAGWTNKTNWLATTTPGNWFGVTVSGGHVTVLSLWWNNLVGNLPPELANLTGLVELYLGGNQFSGSLPPELANLTALQYLYLNDTQFSGSVPAWLGDMTSLVQLDLGSNQFSGSLPPELGNLTALKGLYLYNNQFSGTLPPELANLTALQYLYLYSNQFSGTLPPELANLTALLYLYLHNNQFSGSLPTWLGDITSLVRLNLGGNQFSGGLPPELGNLTALQHLYVYDNQLSGTIPTEVGSLTNLIRLQLQRNQLSGAIPQSLTNLTGLCLADGNSPCYNQFGLDLGYNRLTVPATPQALADFLAVKDPDWADTQWIPWTSCADVTSIPVSECNALVAFYNATGGPNWNDHTDWLASGNPGTWYGVTVSGGHVTRLRLHYNNLVGSLPPELGNLTQLQYLWIPGNYDRLTGTIPSTLSNLTNLETLALYDNHLSGVIPAWLGNLTNLQDLDLGGTQLTGPIPTEISSLSNLRSLNLNLIPIGGTIPTWLGSMTNLDGLGLQGCQFTGTIPIELSTLTNLVWLNLGDNQLSGTLPTWIGSLSQMSQLFLFNNQFTGEIPTEIGNLTNLEYLFLNLNQLSGAVPESFTNLVNLYVEPGYTGLDLGYNRLTVPAAPQALADFLAIKDPDWYLTQAVSEDVTPGEGGELLSNDGSADLLFPPGSAPGTITVTYAPQSSPVEEIPGVQAFAMHAFTVEVSETKPSAYTFAQPVTVTVSYDQSVVDLGYDALGQLYAIKEDTLKLYYWDGAQWIDAVNTCLSPGSYIRDLVNNTVRLHICKSGEFALLGDKQQSLIYLPSIQR